MPVSRGISVGSFEKDAYNIHDEAYHSSGKFLRKDAKTRASLRPMHECLRVCGEMA